MNETYAVPDDLTACTQSCNFCRNLGCSKRRISWPEMPKSKKHSSKMYEKWYCRPYEPRGKKNAKRSRVRV